MEYICGGLIGVAVMFAYAVIQVRRHKKCSVVEAATVVAFGGGGHGAPEDEGP